MKETTKEKILLLLFAGLAFGCSYGHRQQWRVLNTASREWKRLDQKELRDGINYLYRSKFVNKNINNNGFFTVQLTEKGKLKALYYKLYNIKNKKEKWDGKWRMVAFDIPERYKKGRDALRYKLKKFGFWELQKSIFITPYNCEKEMALLIGIFKIEKYVRIGILESIDNGDYFKKVFELV